MSKNTYKCFKCKETFDIAIVPPIKISNRNYCTECAKAKQEEIQAKEKEQAIKQQQADEYKSVIALLCDLTGRDKPCSLWFVQLKQWCKDSLNSEYNFTYKGVELTLDYYFNILGKNVDNDVAILNIVPYYYDRAREFYRDNIRISKIGEAFYKESEANPIIEVNKVVTKNDGLDGNNKIRNNLKIDMNEILGVDYE